MYFIHPAQPVDRPLVRVVIGIAEKFVICPLHGIFSEGTEEI